MPRSAITFIDPDGRPLNAREWYGCYACPGAAPEWRCVGDGWVVRLSWVGIVHACEPRPRPWLLEVYRPGPSGAPGERLAGDLWLSDGEQALAEYRTAVEWMSDESGNSDPRDPRLAALER